MCERGEVWGGYDSVACDMYVLDRRHEWEYRSRGGGRVGVSAHDGVGLWCSLTWVWELKLLLCVQEGLEDKAWVAHVCSMAS